MSTCPKASMSTSAGSPSSVTAASGGATSAAPTPRPFTSARSAASGQSTYGGCRTICAAATATSSASLKSGSASFLSESAHQARAAAQGGGPRGGPACPVLARWPDRWEGGQMTGDDARDGVALTNLDQGLFDGANAAKRDLVDYLDAVADRIIPELRDRPLSVIRVRPGQKPFMQ